MEGIAGRATAPEILQNEFAVVDIAIDRGDTGDRLVVRDLTSGESIRLDPLELEALARTTHATLRTLLRTVAPREE